MDLIKPLNRRDHYDILDHISNSNLAHLNGGQRVFWRFIDLTDLRRPPAELKVASGLSAKNPRGTIYEIISVLKSFFYENITAHF